jgi:hypothetical protein
MMFQTEEATAAALRATELAVERSKALRVRRPVPADEVDTEKLISLVRIMATRYVEDGYRGRIDDWTKLVRLVIRT